MKKFRFKFEVVLQVRKTQEQEALRLLSVAQKKYQEALELKQHWLNEQKKSLQRRETLGSQEIQISAVHGEQDYLRGVKQRIIQSDQGIMRASRGVEKALRAYLVARKQSRAIETLQEQALAEYRKDRTKHEQKEMDDLMVMRNRLKEEVL
jgi:flagellar export protein FliJ